MATIKEKMTAIAWPIRAFMRESETLTLDEMADRVKRAMEANDWLNVNIDGSTVRNIVDNINQAVGDLRGVKEKIVEHGVEVSDGTPTAEYASRVDGVYEVGLADGRDAEWNYFWDTAQQSGTRTNYERAFAGMFWTNELFKPKWDIKPKWGGATSLFQGSPFEGNLREHLESLNVTLDVSGLNGITQMFYTAEKITEIPFLDLSGCTNACSNLFYGCKALITAHIKLSENVPINNNCFTNCTSLENLTVEGTIGASVVLAQSSKLTYESLVSIIGALYDYSGTTETRTLTLHATVKARLSEGDIAVARQKGWTIA